MLDGWYGKLIGALAGYLVGRGWLGALVGLVLGHQFDVMSRRNRRVSGGDPRAPGAPGGAAADPATLSRAFFETTFLVMGHVAKSDGRVTEQEIDAARAAMQRFSLGEADRRRAIELFTQGKAAGFPLEPTLERLREMAGGQADLCRMFVQIQLQAALQGNGLGDRPRGVLQRMCRVLGISPLEFASLEAMLRLRARSEGFGRQSQGSRRAAGDAAGRCVRSHRRARGSGRCGSHARLPPADEPESPGQAGCTGVARVDGRGGARAHAAHPRGLRDHQDAARDQVRIPT